MSCRSDEDRLTQDLEPILRLPDPRTKISAYHDMPYAIFRYDPGGGVRAAPARSACS